ncbi:MAG: alanine racemase [Dehalococcoidia bacterium SM23_28_1]|nr:MAG: alanine racemase [Dehalococcoidia bacterium SM23_28_1]
MQSQGVRSHPWQGRPVWAEIDLDALADNVRLLKSQANGAALMAVVKANAYGHGAVAVARAALAAGADRLGVICVDEGEQLRRAGISAPILVMGHTPVGEAQRLADLSLTPSVVSDQMALALARVASERRNEMPVHLKVDTGLNRYGLPPSEAADLGRWLRDLAGIRTEGLFTHFASADEEDKSYTAQQHKLFLSVAEQLDWVPIRHVSNTATLLRMPDMSLEMVRPGLGIYGCYPSSQVKRSLPLRPVLSLKGRIARLTSIGPGESVSYGRTWRASRPSLIGLVMCGYADGLPRALSNRGSVLVRGRRAPIVGRVCMDMCMVDVSGIPDVAVDDEVVIIGRQGEDEISAEEVAELCGTISYEILCGITTRMPRLYLRQGRIVSKQTLVLELQDEVAANVFEGVLAEGPSPTGD